MSVDPGLAGVQQWRRNPFALAVVIDAGAPFARADKALVGAAAQREFANKS